MSRRVFPWNFLIEIYPGKSFITASSAFLGQQRQPPVSHLGLGRQAMWRVKQRPCPCHHPAHHHQYRCLQNVYAREHTRGGDVLTAPREERSHTGCLTECHRLSLRHQHPTSILLTTRHRESLSIWGSTSFMHTSALLQPFPNQKFSSSVNCPQNFLPLNFAYLSLQSHLELKWEKKEKKKKKSTPPPTNQAGLGLECQEIKSALKELQSGKSRFQWDL